MAGGLLLGEAKLTRFVRAIFTPEASGPARIGEVVVITLADLTGRGR